MSVVQESYTPKPTVKMLTHIADYRSLLDPVVEELHHHSWPWCFRFTYNNSTRKAEMHYKYRSPDAWTPKGAGIILLKVYIYQYVKLLMYVYSIIVLRSATEQ